MCFKCSSTGAVAKLSTAYLEEAKRNHHTCDAHLVPRAVLGTPSTRCSTSSARRSPTSHEQEPPLHLGLRKLNETAARASERTRAAVAPRPVQAQRDGRERRGHVHMREELLTELHIPSWPCGQEGPMVVIDRDSKWRAAHRREGVGARRRTPRATRRIKEECEAELPPGYIAD